MSWQWWSGGPGFRQRWSRGAGGTPARLWQTLPPPTGRCPGTGSRWPPGLFPRIPDRRGRPPWITRHFKVATGPWLRLGRGNLHVGGKVRAPRSAQVSAGEWLRLGHQRMRLRGRGRAPRGVAVGAGQWLPGIIIAYTWKRVYMITAPRSNRGHFGVTVVCVGGSPSTRRTLDGGRSPSPLFTRINP